MSSSGLCQLRNDIWTQRDQRLAGLKFGRAVHPASGIEELIEGGLYGIAQSARRFSSAKDMATRDELQSSVMERMNDLMLLPRECSGRNEPAWDIR